MNSDTNQTQNPHLKLLEIVRKDPSHRNYWNTYNRIKKLKQETQGVQVHPNISIALLSSFTIDPIAAYLDIDSRLLDLEPDIFIGPFNQYQQEILNSESRLYKFNPDIIIFFIQLESMLDGQFRVNFPRMTTSEKKNIIQTTIKSIDQLFKVLMERTQSIILFNNFIIPHTSPFGILDNKQEIGYKKFFRLINDEIEELVKQNSQVFIVDLNEVAARFGKAKYINFPMYYRGSLLFNESFLPVISQEILGYVKAFKAKNRKALVLDLDNTLWGGIIGEDGLEGIKLNVNYPGNEFVDFQKSILSLYNRGIILAINSKNNEEDALEVFQKHPAMQIKEHHIATHKINWNDKVQNIIAISNELNIGLDSMVFFDDNPVERARVQEALPEVLVIDLPKSSTLYRSTLENLNDFNTLSLTKEDFQRGEMYRARKDRQNLERQIPSMDDFIKSLDLVIEIKRSTPFSLPRITSLVNRTNQFNLTTRRYTEIEVKNMHENSEHSKIYTLKVQDRFGDEGIVGVAITRKISDSLWIIDNFLMSCRVIGRKIESIFLYKIINEAKKYNVSILEADFIPTKKNKLAKNFYKNNKLNLIKEREDGSSLWRINPIEAEITYPDLFKVIEDE